MKPLLLAALALVDAAFAGFRAYAGRDGRIRKTRPTLKATRRGLVVGALTLTATSAVALAALLLGTHTTPDARYAELEAAAGRMLLVYAPYTVIVAASLACYLWGPLRASTLAVVIGLGPLTLVRPLVVLAGAVAAAWGSLPAAAVATAASAGVLLVEPLTHRRWYTAPV
ncbi:hypothetical protein OG897_34520 [Streptomyces sp. NBC_00237]|uniref:hypothetical protein n=1 Tax=Streptomyces sp. NBC_00237 TaxID=2975687 RepID=UPI002250E0B8|nr:hypothetical protein [Streptomyces sp. NBC_00237]MCX5206508.1 hypothetical protein [Streptomyces sp. NBC_00237]